MWLALGKREAELRDLSTADYMAYFGSAKRALQAFVASDPRPAPYPEPVSYCDVCEFWQHCEARRRKDDHLSLVAGSTRKQRARLERSGTCTLAGLAAQGADAAVPGIEPTVLASVQQQARTQYAARLTGKPQYDLRRDFDAGSGLELLPEPKPGDLFLDLEGDAFVGDGGLEYLFGLLELGQPSDFEVRDQPGEPNYLRYWATNPAEEKAAFEKIVDRIKQGREEFATMHVFHFGHRENDALKKLSCKHATREQDVDTFLREGVLVDLHTVVRQSLWASVEAYTLKDLEAQHGFTRSVPRRESTRAMQIFGWWLETEEAYDDLAEVRRTLEQYNAEDCRSPSTDQERQLLEIAKSIARNGFRDDSEFRAGSDLLRGRAPRCGQTTGAPLVAEGEDITEAVKRLCLGLDRSALAIQGPPCSGKTYQATQAILALVRAGRRVGVTATGHQVITELLKKLHELAANQSVAIAIHHICDPERFDGQTLPFTIDKDYDRTATRLASGAVQVVGGTSFAWANVALRGSVDVLFIEEAGQLSLANALAVSPAAKNLVLLGDPAQLDQPTKGTHPTGADISALEHMLGEAVTMPSQLGVFLPETRRLHPDICAFTSRIFYEDRARARSVGPCR